MAKDREIEVIVRGALLQSGRVLLCRSVKHRYYSLPGGHVEFGESAARAVIREFHEETGLDVRVVRCVLVNEGSFIQGSTPHHEINLVFHVEPSGGALAMEDGGLPPVPSREKRIAFQWIELAAIVDLDVRPEPIKAWLATGARSPATGADWIPMPD